MGATVGSVNLDVTFDTGKIGEDLAKAIGSQAKGAASAARQEFDEGLKGGGERLESFGKNFSLNVSGPIAGLQATALKAFTGFESSMSKIIGLSGVAADQVRAWDGDVKQIGVDYGQGAQAASDALYFITSSGIQGSQAIDTLRESSKAAAAGLGETQTIADLTTSALNAYADGGLTATHATDVLTAAVAAGKAEPEELAGSLGRVLPIAANLGVSFDQVAGATAAMTLTGSDAAEATTQLRGILSAILKPSQQAEEALRSVGLSSAGLRDQIAKQGLLPTLQTLVNTLGDDSAATAQVFDDVRALNGVMNILGENSEQTRHVMDSVAHSAGATDEAFSAAASTTEFKLNQSLAQAKNGLIALGATVAPVASTLLGAAGAVAEKFAALPQPIQTGVSAVGSIAVAAGAGAFALGKITSGVATSAVALTQFGRAVTLANMGVIAGDAGLAASNANRLGTALGRVSFTTAAAAGGVLALAAGYAVLSARMRDAESLGDPIKKQGEATVRNAKSFQDLQDFIAKANAQTAELQKRFDDVKFDPVEREQIGSLGEALRTSAEEAARFSGQAIRISQEMGVSKDAAVEWITAQSGLGHTFQNADEALRAYRDAVKGTGDQTGLAVTQTQRLAASVGPLAEPFFNLASAQRNYDSAVRGVVAAQRQSEAASRGVQDAERGHEQALRSVQVAQDRQRQSLRAVEDAQRGVIDAQRELNEALQGPSKDDQLNVRSAELAVARAQQRLSQLGKTKPGEKSEPVDPLDRQEAQLNLERAQNDLQRTRAEVAGRVATAQDNLRSAQDRLSDAQRSASDAATAVADAQYGVGKSLQAVADARQAAEDAVYAVRDAQWQASDAARDLSAKQETFNSALERGGALAGPMVAHLENLRDRYPEVAAGLQQYVDQFKQLAAAELAPPKAGNMPAGLQSERAIEGRASGGPVSAGTPYRVTERGAPELYVSGASQWMIPPADGEVVPMRTGPFTPGQDSGPSIVIEHLDVHGPDPERTARATVTAFSKKAVLARQR